ncbi:unnamed protein product [Soboliphyme baturini]|uniref:Secreted protein n=1 Tax=Soboliphyme baturini TaxID=241478 RepID=A0A183IKR9_9BILA|nr:unnamed protein product [Soboliphyme baturini]
MVGRSVGRLVCRPFAVVAAVRGGSQPPQAPQSPQPPQPPTLHSQRIVSNFCFAHGKCLFIAGEIALVGTVVIGTATTFRLMALTPPMIAQ